MVEFAVRWPDMRLWAIERAKVAALAPGVRVSAERDETLTTQVVISVVPAQLETAVSRQVIVTVEAWAADKKAGFDLCQDVMFTLASTPPRGVFVRLVGTAGPQERRDEAGHYFYSGTVTVVCGPVL